MAQDFHLTIRHGEDPDLPALRALIAQCPEAASWADSAPSLVARLDETIVAFVLYRIVAGEGEVLNLAVDPLYRRRGIAGGMLGALLPFAPVWHLEVRASNRAAIALYLAQGFQPIGKRARYYKDGEDALLLSTLSET